MQCQCECGLVDRVTALEVLVATLMERIDAPVVGGKRKADADDDLVYARTGINKQVLQVK
jgi:hypothetical protein